MESLLTGSLSMLTKQRTAPLILELDLIEGVIEARPADPLAAVMTRHQPTITDIRDAGRNVMVTTSTQIKTLDGEHVCTAVSTLVERGA